MSNERPSVIAPVCLAIGALLGLAGSFAPSPELRGLAWGIDGTALVMAAALLAVHFIRHGPPSVGAGFLVFIAGQTLVLSVFAMPLEAGSPLFAAGTALWAAALVLISAAKVMPPFARAFGLVSAFLFAFTAVEIFAGRGVGALSEPLPDAFVNFPVFVLTLFGWAWWCRNPAPRS